MLGWILSFILFISFTLMTLKYGHRVYVMIMVAFVNKETKNWAKYGKGSWVVVTGGSDGIGFGFAQKFAERGFNIVLVARTESKLQAKCQEIKEQYRVKAEYVILDAVKTTDVEGYKKVFAQMDNKDVSIVVNSLGNGCPGFGYDHAMPELGDLDQPWKSMVEKGDYTYENIGDKQALDVTIMDTLPQTMFSRWALEKFEKRTERCALIDLASVVSIFAMWKIAVYSASKTFNRFLTQGLNATKTFMPNKYQNIDFLSVCPGPVATKLQKNSAFGKPTANRQMLMSSIDDCVMGCLRNLGNYHTTYGSRQHEVVFSIGEIVCSVIPEKYMQGK